MRDAVQRTRIWPEAETPEHIGRIRRGDRAGGKPRRHRRDLRRDVGGTCQKAATCRGGASRCLHTHGSPPFCPALRIVHVRPCGTVRRAAFSGSACCDHGTSGIFGSGAATARQIRTWNANGRTSGAAKPFARLAGLVLASSALHCTEILAPARESRDRRACAHRISRRNDGSATWITIEATHVHPVHSA
jgi:hypothetical protein